jgi:cyclopropane-fatty-acyl-phospholipid synthase
VSDLVQDARVALNAGESKAARRLDGAGEPAAVSKIRGRYYKLLCEGAAVRPFAIQLPDRSTHQIGDGAPCFTVAVSDEAGLRALSSLDELSLAEAYMNGHLDIEGSMLDSLKYRRMLSDRRPLRYLFDTYLQALLFGQVSSDKRWIKAHYDEDPEFFTLWLDSKIRGYSHGFFENDGESLETGMERKFRYAMQAAGIQPGMRVLDIGGGWGSFNEFAGSQGVNVTSLTISKVSEDYINRIIAEKNLPCRVIREHFLDHRPAERYDAIVNLGVTEHLPDYRRTVRNYERVLKSGGRIYLDCYSGERFGMPSFITKWVYEGNTSPLCLEKYFAELAATRFEVLQLENDRHNYFLTCVKWAEKLEAARDTIVARWGQHLYRRFRLYLWSAANSFQTGTLSAVHMVMQLR